MIKNLLVLLGLCFALSAQTLYPLAPGYVNGAQPMAGGPPYPAYGQLVNLRTSGTGTFPFCGTSKAFPLGGVAQFEAWAGTIVGSPAPGTLPQWFAIGTCVATYPNCLCSSVGVTIPGGMPGRDQLFLASYSVISPTWSYVASPITGFPTTLYVYDLAVPNNPALIATFLTAQAFHFDVATGLTVLSDRKDGMIL